MSVYIQRGTVTSESEWSNKQSTKTKFDDDYMVFSDLEAWPYGGKLFSREKPQARVGDENKLVWEPTGDSFNHRYHTRNNPRVPNNNCSSNISVPRRAGRLNNR